jgi:hypothetical protein
MDDTLELYFEQSAQYFVLWICVIGIAVSFFWITWVGIVIAAIGLFLFYCTRTVIVSEKQYQAAMAKFFQILNNTAMQKCGLDKSMLTEQPMYIMGPRAWDVNGEKSFFRKKDGVIRYAIADISVFLPTKNKLHVYRVLYNFMGNKILKSRTSAYPYSIISAVTCDTQPFAVKNDMDRHQFKNAMVAKISFCNGDPDVNTVLTDPEIEKLFDGGRIDVSMSQETVKKLQRIVNA